MPQFREILVTVLATAALAGTLVWLAEQPELLDCLQTASGSAGELQTPPNAIRSVERFNWSAAGHRLLFVTRGGDNTNGQVGLLDSDNQNCWLPLDVGGEPIGAATLAPDGLHVLVGTLQGHLAWIDLSTGKTNVLVESSRMTGFTATAVSDDQSCVAAADWFGRVYVGSPLCRGLAVLTSAGAERVVSDLRFSRDGTRLVCAHFNGSVRVWHLGTAPEFREFKGHEGPAAAAEMLPANRHMISTGLDGNVRLWDCETGREIWNESFGKSGILALAVARDGRMAAWGGHDGSIFVWDIERQEIKYEINTAGVAIRHLAFSRGGTILCATGCGNSIRQIDVITGADLPEIEFSPDSCSRKPAKQRRSTPSHKAPAPASN
jgi:WD40 repeat protein